MTNKATRSEIGRYSRNKGSRYERDVCKKLGKFFYDDPKSFSRYGVEMGVNVPGDFGPCIPNNIAKSFDLIKDFPFCFEAKNREEWEFHSLLTNPTKSHLFHYWEQAVNQSERFGKIPFLIFTKNYMPDFGMLDVTAIYQSDCGQFVIPNVYLATIIKVSYLKKYTLTIFKLDEFIEVNQSMTYIRTMRDNYRKIINAM